MSTIYLTGTYEKVFENSCDTRRGGLWNKIIEKAECERAAISLSLKTTNAVSKESRDLPHGCVYGDDGFLAWNSFDSKIDCGYKDDQGSTYACVCRKPGKHNF